MAAPAKLVEIYGCLFKLEGSYDAGGSLSAATDGVLLEEKPLLAISYANDGRRSAPPGTLGYQRGVAPSGKVGSLPAKFAPKGAGAAYSAGVTPNIHNLLRACGMDGTVATGVGTESWTYNPTPGPTGYASGVASLYSRGQLYPYQAILGDWALDIKAGEVPIFTATLNGKVGAVTDVSVPAITYPALGFDAPKAVSIAFALNGVTLVLKSASLKYGRQIGPRLDANVSGHAGYAPGRRTPSLDIEFETPALSSFDALALYEAATGMTWTLAVGSAQYNRYTIFGPNSSAQIMKAPAEGNDGSVATTKLSLALNPSGLNQNDELTWRFN